MPGPGAYDPARKEAVKYTRIGKGQRPGLLADPSLPGPGAYNLALKNFTPKYSISRRHKTSTGWTETKDTPAPNAYSPAEQKPRGLTIGKSTRSLSIQERQHHPGPGHYGSPLPRRPALSFTKSTRAFHEQKATPGPGAYRPETRPAGKKGFSMASKSKTAGFKDEKPGPGMYSPQYNLTKPEHKSSKFGKEPVLRQLENGVPGPGAYNYNLPESASKITMGTGLRPSPSGEQVPGPGAYEVRPKSSAPGFTMGQRPLPAAPESLPGPGEYQSVRPVRSTGSLMGRIGKEQRLREQESGVPGPGSYEQRASRTGGFKFGRARGGCCCQYQD